MKTHPIIIIILGPPGSGKGTQSHKISKHFHIPHISTGDILRENIARDTDLGRKAKEFMNAGHLVPDDLVIELLLDRVGREDCQNGYILDGFPRTIAQAEAFEKKGLNNELLCVFNLDVSDDEVVRRISGRLVCKNCSNVQHKEFDPPQQQGMCDRCGGELHQRPDDREEVVRKRLEVYKKQTQPLVEYYAEKDILKPINGEQNPQKILEELIAKINSF